MTSFRAVSVMTLFFTAFTLTGCDTALIEENKREQQAAKLLLAELAKSRQEPQLPASPPRSTQKTISHIYRATQSQGGQDKTWEEFVFFGNGFCSVSKNGTEKIYDFKKQRQYIVDHASKTYTDDSLFVLLFYKIYEFQNRRMIAKAYKQALRISRGHWIPWGLKACLGSSTKRIRQTSNYPLRTDGSRWLQAAKPGPKWNYQSKI